jgi:hypothetical protein
MADIKTLAASAPEKIFLVIGEGCPADVRFDLLEEVTWCQDDIDGNGIAYIKAEAHQTEVARLTRENEGLAKDAARLDYLQQRGATVEFLPGGHGGYFFRIGGLRRAVHADIRIAIDAALAGASGAAGEGAEQ